MGLIRESWDAGTLTIHDDVLPSAVDAQATQLAAAIAPELPGAVLTRAVVAWTQLFGMISFELFGQLVGSFDPSDAFFDHAVEQMVEYVGLHSTRERHDASRSYLLAAYLELRLLLGLVTGTGPVGLGHHGGVP